MYMYCDWVETCVGTPIKALCHQNYIPSPNQQKILANLRDNYDDETYDKIALKIDV